MNGVSRAAPSGASARPGVGIVRRHPVSSFFVLACLFGWSPYAVGWVTGAEAQNIPLGPVVAAAVGSNTTMSPQDPSER